MKKNYFFTMAFAATTICASAQTINEGFESVNLDLDTFINNAPNGTFVFGEVKFSNEYYPDFDYNNGFSLTNMRNDTVGDYTNSHSAITASGRNSENYLAFYSNGTIDLSSSPLIVKGLYITNATYSYLSMLNGDSYGKQFGSTKNASGETDGTNGEDYFRVIIKSFDAENLFLDSVVHYLADFRFANNDLDYIQNDWSYVDLTALNSQGRVESISFELQSSDNHPQFGMNTPAYFAMDDFQYEISDAALNEIENNVVLGPNPVKDILKVSGIFDHYAISDLQGRNVLEGSNVINPSIDFTNLPAGTYLFKGTSSGKQFATKISK